MDRLSTALLLSCHVVLIVACSGKTLVGDARSDWVTDPTLDTVDAEIVTECTEGPRCDGDNVTQCDVIIDWCDPGRGEVCVDGACEALCDHVDLIGNNLGCEFWAVDLDNAAVWDGMDASAQQFAVIVVNPGSAEVSVSVERNDAAFGESADVVEVMETSVGPGEMATLLLDEREVDGSTPDGLNDGTGTALTAGAFHVVTDGPVAAYQFNPLQNADVFSNDASLLVPAHHLGETYDVMGWPQTMADTTDPTTDMENDFRAFLTVVGTEASTSVTVRLPGSSTMATAGDGDTISALGSGDTLEVELGPFEVLNLETDGFLSDFTGSVVTASGPVAVFSGSETSDVPFWNTLADRLCCSDHLEHQLYPSDQNGTSFVAALTPLRTRAVREAGGSATVPSGGEPEVFRILALENGTDIVTTLPAPDDGAVLDAGQHWTIEARQDFVITADAPVSVGQFVEGQGATGLLTDLPNGDPTFILMTPSDRWRRTYTFAIPNAYVFDFIIMAHAPGAGIQLDDEPLPGACVQESVEGAAEYAVTRCQLSFPAIVGDVVEEGLQGDGVHEITSDSPLSLVVYGFDNAVSYGYPGGMNLE